MAQDRLTMTFLLCPPYDIITWAGQPQAAGILSQLEQEYNKTIIIKTLVL